MNVKNTKMKYMIVLIVILVAAMASGCGKEVVPEPTNTPEPTVIPAPTNTLEPENTPEPATATPHPSGDTWDVSEEVPLEDWQIEIVMNDLEKYWEIHQRFEGSLDCDALVDIVSSIPATSEAFQQACQNNLDEGSFILGPRFDWLTVTDSSVWPSYKAEAWPGGVALELDTEQEWETYEINLTNGTRQQTLYGKRVIYYAFLVFEDGMWRIYSLNKEVMEAENQ